MISNGKRFGEGAISSRARRKNSVAMHWRGLYWEVILSHEENYANSINDDGRSSMTIGLVSSGNFFCCCVISNFLFGSLYLTPINFNCPGAYRGNDSVLIHWRLIEFLICFEVLLPNCAPRCDTPPSRVAGCWWHRSWKILFDVHFETVRQLCLERRSVYTTSCPGACPRALRTSLSDSTRLINFAALVSGIRRVTFSKCLLQILAPVTSRNWILKR